MYSKFLANILIGIGSLVFICFVIFLYRTHFIALSGDVDLTSSAFVGDFIGGVVGSIWALAGVILLYRTLVLQQTSINDSNKHNYLLTTDDLINRYVVRCISLQNNLFYQINYVDKSKGKAVKETLTGLGAIERVSNNTLLYENTTGLLYKDFQFILAPNTQAYYNNIYSSLDILISHIDKDSDGLNNIGIEHKEFLYKKIYVDLELYSVKKYISKIQNIFTSQQNQIREFGISLESVEKGINKYNSKFNTILKHIDYIKSYIETDFTDNMESTITLT